MSNSTPRLDHAVTGRLVGGALLLLAVSAGGCAPAGGFDDERGQETVALSDAPRITGFDVPQLTASERASVLARYQVIDPQAAIAADLLNDALVFYDAHKAQLTNPNFLTIVDFSLDSGHERLFMVDMATGSVEPHVVAHGSGSDPDDTGMATLFSNTPMSHQSSLGYYLTAEVRPDTDRGVALMLDGLSDSDWKVRSRAIWVHGGRYVSDGRAKQGMSFGCFVLPEAEKIHVIDSIKGGSLIYAGVATGDPIGTRCHVKGAPGHCVDIGVAGSCGGTTVPGHCPGPAAVQCCVATAAQSP
jgi:hypothetical protein